MQKFVCEHCGADLKKSGVTMVEKVEMFQPLTWDGEGWFQGDREEGDSQGGLLFFCPECDERLLDVDLDDFNF